MLRPKTWIIVACILGGLGVVMGAFGSHLLPSFLEGYDYTAEARAKRIDAFEIGVRYEIYHALALLAVGLLSLHRDHLGYRVAGLLMILGSLLFSGGLFVYALSPLNAAVHIVPIGGVMLICGWLAMIPGGLALDRPRSQ